MKIKIKCIHLAPNVVDKRMGDPLMCIFGASSGEERNSVVDPVSVGSKVFILNIPVFREQLLYSRSMKEIQIKRNI